MSIAVINEGTRPLDTSRHLRAAPDGAPQISRHAPDPAADQRLDDLLVSAGKGSAQAYEVLYVALMPQVYRVALRLVRDPDMAEDIAQEALVEAWRLAPTFSTAKGTAKAWVLTIAHRRAVDRIRKEQRERDRMAREAATQADVAPEPEQEAVVQADHSAWQTTRVRQALDTLSDKQREALELAYYSGKTQSEVSESLGVPLGTVKTRMRDAMIKLRDVLKEVE